MTTARISSLRVPAFAAGTALAALCLAGCDGPSTPAQQVQAAPAAQASASAQAAPAAQGPTTPISYVAAWGQDGKSDVDASAALDDNIEVVMDGSGSMSSGDCSSHRSRDGRMADARDAMIRFERGVPVTTNLGLYVFDREGWGERVPLGRGPQNRAAFEAAVSRVSAGGSTPLGPSISWAYDALHAQAARQGGYGTYRIVVETDGEPDSMPALRASVDKVVHSPIVLETLGFCITDKGHPLNRPGQTVYHEAQDPAQLTKGLDAILAETDAFSDDAVAPAPTVTR